MEFGEIVKFAQSVWPVAVGIGAVSYLYGWISPAVSRRQNINVVERANKLRGLMNAQKELGHKPKLKNRINLAILNITRGAFLHQNIYSNSMEPGLKKLRNERKK